MIIIIIIVIYNFQFFCNNFSSLIFMATVLFVVGSGCSTTLLPAIIFVLQRQHFNCKITHAKIVTFGEIV